MSQLLISRSPDLRRLADDGYDVDIVSGHLIVRDVPYVNADRKVKQGILVSTLDLAGDVTARPTTHVVMFSGEYPCDRGGCALEKIRCGSDKQVICDELTVHHTFSSKPVDGYENYILVLDLYLRRRSACNQLDPEVVRLSKVIGRTPGAVSRRLGNYMSLDSTVTSRGLENISADCKKVWNEFSGNPDRLRSVVAGIRQKSRMRKG